VVNSCVDARTFRARTTIGAHIHVDPLRDPPRRGRSVLLFLFAAVPALADNAPGATSTEILRKSTWATAFRSPIRRTPEITAAIVEVKPGADTGVHQHDNPLFAYILEGELTVTIADGSSKIYKAGDALMETSSPITATMREPRRSSFSRFTSAPGVPSRASRDRRADDERPRLKTDCSPPSESNIWPTRSSPSNRISNGAVSERATRDLDALSLMERVRRAATALDAVLPADLDVALDIVRRRRR